MVVATDRFLAEIRRSHQVVSYIDVVSPTRLVTRLTATDGSVTDDITADFRRHCSVTCVDVTGDLTPTSMKDLLEAPGTELRPYRGVVYADGTREVQALGVFRISAVDVDDSVGGSPDIKIEGYDRSRTVARKKFIEPYTVAAGTNVVTAIKVLIQRSFEGAEFDAISSSVATTAATVYDADTSPWDAVQALATSIGCIVYFDETGKVVIATPPDIDALASPDFSFIEGTGCTMTNISSKFTDEPGFNGVVLSGESLADEKAPVRAVVWDEEPTSPTYHKGPYDEVPEFVTDPNVKTVAEATNAAKARLQSNLGGSQLLSITAWPNPALKATDVVEVLRERITGPKALYAVDSVVIPMSAATASTIIVRRKRVVS